MNIQPILPGFAKSIKASISKYLQSFPKESERLSRLNALVNEAPDEESLYDRKNFAGHITASALVLSSDRKMLLFIEHKYLKRRLQPGGHVDIGDETILAAAKREVFEETGLKEISPIPYHNDFFLPIDVDTHDIPANPLKDEPGHLHHDFRFLFSSDATVNLDPPRQTNDGELTWVTLEEAATQVTFQMVVEKIRVALSQEFLPRKFFRLVREEARFDERCSAIAITHLLPDVRSYLEALSAAFVVQAVVPKPKSIVPAIRTELEKQFPLVDLSRQEIEQKTKVFEVLDRFAGKFVLFDIGGYFAPIANDLVGRYKDRFLGVLEDTENGHQKYEEAHKRAPLKLPVISVARSPLKDNEDFLVGQSVLFSADAVLRDCGKLIQYMPCGVIGYGKIGRSIAHHLLLRGIKPVVYDRNPIRRIQAHNHLCETPPKESLFKDCAALFSATGSQALGLLDFQSLKPGCFLFSVTSSDDEFDTEFLAGNYIAQEVAPKVFRYTSNSHHFYLVNQGNAVNFLHKAVLGPFIHLVRAEMIYGAACLARREIGYGIHELSPNKRHAIAEAWVRTFLPEKDLTSNFEIRDVLV